ncbi:tetratricopeptide repeat protein [uncultured Lacinutrix sp.]|uniref:tetratricopeptide repeat protein n=1 Tax=uncultured Lacinutrix sp. TaxID=574032 RepID=UPI00262BF1A0|nr:tetratricopeptide repeat protein [uncultured Lacinutrix sp.]
MTLKLRLYFFLFICYTSISYSQNKIDSLQSIWENDKEIDSVRFNAIRDYYNINNHSQPDSTLVVLDYYYKLAKEKNATRDMYRALNKKGNIYRLKRDFDKALDLYNGASDLAIELNNPVLQAIIIGNIGNIFLKKQNYKEATLYYTKALKIFQEQKDYDGEGRMLTSLAGIYLTIGSYDLALDYYNKSLLIYNKRGIKNTSTAVNLMNIGWINYEKEQYDKALVVFNDALTILEPENKNFFIAGCYSSLAKIHHKLGDLNQANVFAEKNLKMATKLNVERNIIEALLIKAQLAFETNVEDATKKAEAVLRRLPTGIDKEIKKEVYQLLYKCYKNENKLELSLKMHELYTVYNDSIQQERNSFAIAREAVKNDFEVKIYETELENDKKQKALKHNQQKRTLGIITAAALLIICIVLYFRSNIKKNRKKREALLEEIEQLKSNTATNNLIVDSDKFKLIRSEIEASINRKLNETDWKVLNILLDQPEITNKEIAAKAYLSVDGIGSSLRRMYTYFDIKETKYKKISLLTEAIKRSNN